MNINNISRNSSLDLAQLIELAELAKNPNKVQDVAVSILKNTHSFESEYFLKSLQGSNLTNDEKVYLFDAIQEIFNLLNSSQHIADAKECCSLLAPTLEKLRGGEYVPHIQKVPKNIMTYILSYLDLMDLCSATFVGKQWKETACGEFIWKEVANKIGFTHSGSSPLEQQLKHYITALRDSVLKIPNLPEDVKELARQKATIENVKLLMKWKEARDTLVFWKAIANYILAADKSKSDECGSIQETLDKATGLGPWMEENKSAFNRLYQLNLSNKQLTYLPEGIKELKQLHELNLSSNELSKLPEEIADLKQLQVLNLAQNKLSHLPQGINSLTKLNNLNLTCNQFLQLPEGIEKLIHLQTLYFSYNQLSQLPKRIGKLKQLRLLDFSKNQLSRLPKGIGKLKQLRYLYLSKNQLCQLPKGIGELIHLQILLLDNNQLFQLPKGITNLKQLLDINLNHNQFTKFPGAIVKLTRLNQLSLYSNPLSKEARELAAGLKKSGINLHL